MKNYGQLALFRVLFAVACVGCAGGDGDETTTDPESSTSGEAIGSSDPSTTSGSSGGTTDAATEDTGIATTPPQTDGGTESSSSGEEGSNSTTAEDESITVELSYEFLGEVAGVPLDCAAAETLWVDVSVFPAIDPDDRTYDLEDLPCDDAVISVGPLPLGTYSIGVVAWDQNLWDGSTGDFIVDGATDPLPVMVELTQFPNP